MIGPGLVLLGLVVALQAWGLTATRLDSELRVYRLAPTGQALDTEAMRQLVLQPPLFQAHAPVLLLVAGTGEKLPSGVAGPPDKRLPEHRFDLEGQRFSVTYVRDNAGGLDSALIKLATGDAAGASGAPLARSESINVPFEGVATDVWRGAVVGKYVVVMRLTASTVPSAAEGVNAVH